MNISTKRWAALISTGIMIMLVNLDMTIVNLAVSVISSGFSADINQAQWVVSGYLLATALSFIIFGRLADHFGKKKLFLIGILIFTAASLVAGINNSLMVLICSRFIQGLGFASTLGLSILFFTNTFPVEKKGFATGMAVLVTGASQMIGPTIGGVILQYWNWHGIFLINVPLGMMSFILATIAIPADNVIYAQKLPFRIGSAILLVTGLSIILCTLNQISKLDIDSILILLFSGLFILFFFIFDCKKRENGLMNVGFFNNYGFVIVITLRFLFMIMMASLLFVIPLYLQNTLDFSPLKTGFTMLFMTAFVAITSPITGKLIDKVGFALPLMISFALSVISVFLITWLQIQFSYIIIISLIFFGCAVGSHTTSSINGALTQVEQKNTGSAIGIFFTAAITGAVVGVAISGSIINVFSQHFLGFALKNIGNKVSETTMAILLRSASGTNNIYRTTLSDADIAVFHPIVNKVFLQTIHVEALFLSSIMIIALILSIRLNKYLKQKSRLKGNN